MTGHWRLPSAGLLMAKLNKRLMRALCLVAALFLTLQLVSLRVSQLSVAPGSTGWPFLNARRQTTEAYPFETTSSFYPVVDADAENKTIAELCESFPKYLLQRIQPILKMGHGEPRSQIEAQLQTVSACFDSDELLLVFSDLDEVILGRHAIDILANLPERYHHDNPDFAPYDALQQMLNIRPKKQGVLDATVDPTAGKHGWKLDKYKFLAEVERAWLMRPGRDWYVFYETDTYILWDNMFRFLSTLDPAAPLYMGSPSPGREGTWFANGGPGFVLSRGAMEKLLSHTEPPLTLRGLEMLKGDCCGDSVLGWMLWQAGVPISGFFPLFNTYPAHRIPFTERSWCQPVLTLHKSTPQDMLDLWRWEHRERKLGRPLLYSDLYEFRRVTKPGNAVRYDWDNTNYDRLAPGRDVPGDSVDACSRACEADPTCLQYLWRGKHAKQCVLMPFVTLGSPREDETATEQVVTEAGEGEAPTVVTKVRGYSYTSGWMTARIRAWETQHRCATPDWVHPSVERHY